MKTDVLERHRIDRYTPLRWLGYTIGGGFVVLLLAGVKIHRWWEFWRL
jgi:hypothetical protein